MNSVNDRQFEVVDPRPGENSPIVMSEDEFRQTYGFLIDVIDLEGFRHVSVVADDTRIEVNEVFNTRSQHVMPQ